MPFQVILFISLLLLPIYTLNSSHFTILLCGIIQHGKSTGKMENSLIIIMKEYQVTKRPKAYRPNAHLLEL